jgi:hypothetical protein
MQLGEIIVASIVLAVCIVLLVRLALGAARRDRFDRTMRNAWERGPVHWWRLAAQRQARARRLKEDRRRHAEAVRLEAMAQRETLDAISRARDRAQGRAPAPSGPGGRVDADVDGNVIRPRAFRKAEPGATHPGNDTRH